MSSGGSSPRLHVRWNLIRSEVEKVLEKYHDGSLPVNVEEIAGAMGVKIQPVDIQDDELSGFFFRDSQGGQAIIGVNKTQSKVRRRFTIAHELCHFWIHDSQDVRYDRKGNGYDYGRIMPRNADSSTGEKRDEVEANFFAAELLMPRSILADKLLAGKTLDFLETDTDDTIRKLAKEFDVSVQALTVRLVQLRIIEAF